MYKAAKKLIDCSLADSLEASALYTAANRAISYQSVIWLGNQVSITRNSNIRN